jgi:hypothetical protein
MRRGGDGRRREEEAAEVREGPDNETAAVVEATAFRARAPAGSLHDLACPCGVSAQSPPCISCRGFARHPCMSARCLSSGPPPISCRGFPTEALPWQRWQGCSQIAHAAAKRCGS